MKRLTPKQAYRAVRRHLSPDLLKPKYRKRVEGGACDPRTGHCYAASEAFYHLVGGRDEGFKPMFLVHENEPHWWVRGPDGKDWDLTSEQFSTPVPYGKGKGKGFLTRDPSRRAAEIIRRVTKGKRAMSNDLRSKLIRLAHSKPELRADLLPLITAAEPTPGNFGWSVKHAGVLRSGLRIRSKENPEWGVFVVLRPMATRGPARGLAGIWEIESRRGDERLLSEGEFKRFWEVVPR